MRALAFQVHVTIEIRHSPLAFSLLTCFLNCSIVDWATCVELWRNGAIKNSHLTLGLTAPLPVCGSQSGHDDTVPIQCPDYRRIRLQRGYVLF